MSEEREAEETLTRIMVASFDVDEKKRKRKKPVKKISKIRKRKARRKKSRIHAEN